MVVCINICHVNWCLGTVDTGAAKYPKTAALWWYFYGISMTCWNFHFQLWNGSFEHFKHIIVFKIVCFRSQNKKYPSCVNTRFMFFFFFFSQNSNCKDMWHYQEVELIYKLLPYTLWWYIYEYIFKFVIRFICWVTAPDSIFFFFSFFKILNIWPSSWDYGTYHIGDQRRLRRACASAQSRQSLRWSHTQSMERVRPKNRHLAQLDSCACAFKEWVYEG